MQNNDTATSDRRPPILPKNTFRASARRCMRADACRYRSASAHLQEQGKIGIAANSLRTESEKKFFDLEGYLALAPGPPTSCLSLFHRIRTSTVPQCASQMSLIVNCTDLHCHKCERVTHRTVLENIWPLLKRTLRGAKLVSNSNRVIMPVPQC